MIKKIIFSAAIVGLLTAVSCKNSGSATGMSDDSLKKQTDQKSTQISQKSQKGTLLFFMNPDGPPCQEQDQYINQKKTDIEKHVTIQYVKTTETSDRDSFYQYGIRALPSIIILDSQNNIAKRFTPGIQSADKILEEINKLKAD